MPRPSQASAWAPFHRFPMHATELGDRLVVRRQAAQPHPSTLRRHSASSRRDERDLLKITVRAELQKIARIVAGTTCLGGFSSYKSQKLKVKRLNGIDYSANMVGWNQFVQQQREQPLLTTRLASDITHARIFP